MDDEADDTDITARQSQALVALMTKPTVRAAAAAAGVSVRTLHYWMRQEAFRRRYRAARNAVVDDAVLILQKSTVAAATALRRCLASDHEGTRVRAAQIILGLAIEVNGLLDMADDLADLNRKIDALGHSKNSPNAGGGGERGTHALAGSVPGQPPAGGGAPGPRADGGVGTDSGLDLGALFDDR